MIWAALLAALLIAAGNDAPPGVLFGITVFLVLALLSRKSRK